MYVLSGNRARLSHALWRSVISGPLHFSFHGLHEQRHLAPGGHIRAAATPPRFGGALACLEHPEDGGLVASGHRQVRGRLRNWQWLLANKPIVVVRVSPGAIGAAT